MAFVTPLGVVKKVSGQALSISIYAIAPAGFEPSGMDSINTVHDDDLGRLPVTQVNKIINSYTPLITVLKRDTSSPKNGTDLSMLLSEPDTLDCPQYYFIYAYAVFSDLMHIRGDERGNTVSDQKMRGGIAG